MVTDTIHHENKVNPQRIRYLSTDKKTDGPVIYWMSRDQRVHDNWALAFAQEEAEKRKTGVMVVFCYQNSFLDATQKLYAWMEDGLRTVALTLAQYNIPFIILKGKPLDVLPQFIQKQKAGLLISDFSPLKVSIAWKNDVAHIISIPFAVVDAHNIVPVWIASNKQEYAARTIRPKIYKHLDTYLTEFPSIKKQATHYRKIMPQGNTNIRNTIHPFTWKSGELPAIHSMNDFLEKKLLGYAIKRNNPTLDWQSNLSVYLHFGQLSAQRVAIETKKQKHSIDQKAFLEELIIRRELADNFCYYNKQYDTCTSFPNWAQKSLERHMHDKRQYTYSYSTFEEGKTHDSLWNACQIQMIQTGKMHGYMRMYWAKKILEWTRSPQEALSYAIKLNDTYELDGRDPNGYTGIAWSIGGVHDRPWFERPIYGTIRYMSDTGCKNKFSVQTYCHTYQTL